MYMVVYKNYVKDEEGYSKPIYDRRDVVIALGEVYQETGIWPSLVRSTELDSSWDGFWDDILDMYPRLKANTALKEAKGKA